MSINNVLNQNENAFLKVRGAVRVMGRGRLEHMFNPVPDEGSLNSLLPGAIIAAVKGKLVN